jgi:UV DNA damage endonuclease
MIRFGLCCLFKNESVKFRHSTAKNLQRFESSEYLQRLSELCLHNSKSLLTAVDTVDRLGIRSFRVMTPMFPLYTHPSLGYALEDLPDRSEILKTLSLVKEFKQDHDIRLSLHPDQFNVLNSLRPEVVDQSVKELEYQNILAGLIGANVINIHIGGVYGDKKTASERFIENFNLLSDGLKNRLTIENDDRSYTPEDLAPISEKTGIPIVYDVHHHRCNKDSLSVKEATDLSINTWKRLGREPYFHISSPKSGWDSKNVKAHSDYIDINDFPEYWRELKIDFTLDFEAKDKELAVLKLKEELNYT